VAKAAYPTPEDAILAFVRRRSEEAQDVELVYIETDGRWAVGEVTSVLDGARQNHTVFVLKRDEEDGWTFQGGGGGAGSGGGCSWVLAPKPGQPGYDGRQGVAFFSIDVPPDAEELRVWYRTRHLSLRQRPKSAPVNKGRAFATVWDCHSTWGTTRIQARRAGRWERLDPRSRSFPFRTTPGAGRFVVARAPQPGHVVSVSERRTSRRISRTTS
jgi:hypothetical protein